MSTKKFTKAEDALKKGDLSKADKLFAEIEEHEKDVAERVGRAAFFRGEIAQQETRWKDAAKHYAHAAQFDPNFDTVMKAQAFFLAIGDYDSALSFGKDTQKAAIKEFGEESAEYAESLNNLGGVYQEMERYEEAKPLHEKSLQIRRKILEENHPDIANSLNNLGGSYQELGEYKEAEPYLKEALEIRKSILEDDHPDTATIVSNLAMIYFANGDYEKTRKSLQEALRIREECLGKKHPDTALSLYNIGAFYTQENKDKDAEPLLQEALEILESTLGPDHITTKKIKASCENFRSSVRVAANSVGAPI